MFSSFGPNVMQILVSMPTSSEPASPYSSRSGAFSRVYLSPISSFIHPDEIVPFSFMRPGASILRWIPDIQNSFRAGWGRGCWDWTMWRLTMTSQTGKGRKGKRCHSPGWEIEGKLQCLVTGLETLVILQEPPNPQTKPTPAYQQQRIQELLSFSFLLTMRHKIHSNGK